MLARKAGYGLGLLMLLSGCGGSSSEEAEPDEAGENSAQVCAEDSLDQVCRFGQVAEFTARAGSAPSKPIEITVTAPEVFTPDTGADVEGATQAENVFFLVTLTNRSDDEPWSNLMILTDVVSAGIEGSEIYVDGVCCGGRDSGMLIPEEVPPGESITFRDEWSVTDVNDITYTLDLEGLAGHSIDFTH